MTNMLYSIAGILIPFIGTSLGSSLVFFLKNHMNEKFQKIIVGFACRSYASSFCMVSYFTIC